MNFQSNLSGNLAQLSDLIIRDKWVFKYDDVSDILYFSGRDKSSSSDSILVPIEGNCISVRLSRDGIIEGIFVEDFLALFVPMHKEFKTLARAIKKLKKATSVEPSKFETLYKALVFDTLKIGSLPVRV